MILTLVDLPSNSDSEPPLPYGQSAGACDYLMWNSTKTSSSAGFPARETIARPRQVSPPDADTWRRPPSGRGFADSLLHVEQRLLADGQEAVARPVQVDHQDEHRPERDHHHERAEHASAPLETGAVPHHPQRQRGTGEQEQEDRLRDTGIDAR